MHFNGAVVVLMTAAMIPCFFSHNHRREIAAGDARNSAVPSIEVSLRSHIQDSLALEASG